GRTGRHRGRAPARWRRGRPPRPPATRAHRPSPRSGRAATRPRGRRTRPPRRRRRRRRTARGGEGGRPASLWRGGGWIRPMDDVWHVAESAAPICGFELAGEVGRRLDCGLSTRIHFRGLVVVVDVYVV